MGEQSVSERDSVGRDGNSVHPLAGQINRARSINTVSAAAIVGNLRCELASGSSTCKGGAKACEVLYVVRPVSTVRGRLNAGGGATAHSGVSSKQKLMIS